MHAYKTLPKLGAKRLGGETTWGENGIGAKWLECGGEMTKGENRGKTGGNVLEAKRLVTVWLQYITKMPSCQPDLVDAQNNNYLA